MVRVLQRIPLDFRHRTMRMTLSHCSVPYMLGAVNRAEETIWRILIFVLFCRRGGVFLKIEISTLLQFTDLIRASNWRIKPSV